MYSGSGSQRSGLKSILFNGSFYNALDALLSMLADVHSNCTFHVINNAA